MGIVDILNGRRTYFDTNVFIYALEGYTPFAGPQTGLFRSVDRGELEAVTSELALAEALVKPILDGNMAAQGIYQRVFQTTESLRVLPVTRGILVQAAHVRAASTQIKLADAIHLATALAGNCEVLLTNDRRMKAAAGLSVLLLSDVGAA